MKKILFYLIAASALLVPSLRMTANEAAPSLTARAILTLQRAIADPEAIPAKGALKQRTRAEQGSVLLSNLTGDYISRDFSIFTIGRENNTRISISDDNGRVIVSNLYGLHTNVTGTWDAASSTIIINPQEVYNHTLYGSCTVNTYTIGSNGMPVFNETAPITVTVNDDGSLSMTPWGIFVASGESKGSVFQAYSSSTLCKPNATFHTYAYGSTTPNSYTILISKDDESSVSLGNLFNNGIGINVTLSHDNKATISPQFVHEQDMFGEFWVYSGKENTSKKILAIDKTNLPTLTKTDNGYALTPWGVYCLRSTDISAATGVTDTIVTDVKLDFPGPTGTLTGAGTKDDPYIVATASDLRNLALSVTSTNNYQGKYISMTADIDLSDWKASWTPIGGVSEAAFEGSFNGNGHTMKGLKTNFYGLKYGGLFGLTGSSSSISNLNVKEYEYMGTGTNIGGIVAYAKGTVSNCNSEGKINSKSVEIGGIAGKSENLIDNCHFKGTLIGGVDLGGIAGYSTKNISNCSAIADIRISTYIPNGYGTHAAGGILGAAYGKSAAKVTVTKCNFAGTITDPMKTDQLGGIVGAGYYAIISGCFNVGQITCYAGAGADGNSPCAGGILGYSADVNVFDSYNAGVVNAPSCDFTGGIVGYIGGNSSSIVDIERCYNSGMIISASNCETLGIVGNRAKLTKEVNIRDCFYDKQTTGLSFTGLYNSASADLTSGNSLPGFSEDLWVFEKGLYPRLKGMETSQTALLSASPLLLSENEEITKIKKDFAVNQTPGVEWAFLDSEGNLVKECNGFSLSDNEIKLKNVYAYETLVAINGEKSYKQYILREVPSTYKGEGTQDNPYQISSSDDLMALQEGVNVHRQTHRGDYFLQTCDIDVAGKPEFVGIASGVASSSSFAGTYDGGNHYIHNFKLDATTLQNDGTGNITPTGYNFGGLFGITTIDAAIRNVRIASDCSFNIMGYSAPVVGYSMGIVENCRNYAPVTSYSKYTGGVVGVALKGNISGCYNAGTIKSFDGYTGGIVGYSSVEVDASQNSGSITLTEGSFTTVAKHVGGIAGVNYSTVSNSINTGVITAPESVGGIIGSNSIESSSSTGGNVIKCLGLGAVVPTLEGTTKSGAIIGDNLSYMTIVTNMYDNQITGVAGANSNDASGIVGLPTATLTYGENPINTVLEKFTFTKDSYPYVTSLADDETLKADAASLLVFAPTDTRKTIENKVTLKIPQGVKATVSGGSTFEINGNELTFTLDEDADSETGILNFESSYGIKSIPITALKAIFQGAGTVDDPHIIADKTDMARLANAVNEKGRTYANHNFRLTSDLDYTGDNTFVSIANETGKSFCGIFDGNDKKIIKLKFGDATDKTQTYSGIFGHVGAGAVIKNLNADSCAVSAYQYAGIFAGELAGNIKNCHSTSTVTAYSYAGGFAGVIRPGGGIYNSTNHGSVTLTGANYAGGFSAGCYGSIYDCVNEATITGVTGYVGGITGMLKGDVSQTKNKGALVLTKLNNNMGGIAAIVEAGTSISLCENSGTFTNGKGYIGGIYGNSKTTAAELKLNGAIVTKCINRADITGGSAGTNIAGIAGLMAPGQKLNGCENFGNISALGNYVGGIAGAVNSSATYSSYVLNCVNHGKIDQSGVSEKQYTGGIVGKSAQYGSLENCINKGQVISGGYMAGGIAGNVECPLTGCVNIADVTGNSYAIGGIAGYGGSSSTIEGSLNSGKVMATGTTTKTYGRAGGLLGYGYTKILNSANYGDVTAPDNLAGITGTGFTGISVNNCYNAGKITATDPSVSKIGNIYAGQGVSGENNYYLSSVNPELTTDAKCGAKAVGETELMDLNLGEGFCHSEASYPTPAYASDKSEARFHTARYRLADNDSENNISTDFKIGTARGLYWSTNKPHLITITDSDVKVEKQNGEVFYLTCKEGNREKTYEFQLAIGSGIEENDTVKEVSSIRYYSLEGVELPEPTVNVPMIVITTYSDGTSAVRKAVVK